MLLPAGPPKSLFDQLSMMGAISVLESETCEYQHNLCQREACCQTRSGFLAMHEVAILSGLHVEQEIGCKAYGHADLPVFKCMIMLTLRPFPGESCSITMSISPCAIGLVAASKPWPI